MAPHAIAGKSMKQYYAGCAMLQPGSGQVQHTTQRFSRGVGELHKPFNTGILHRAMTS
jgi:hypothetical protein